MKKTYHLYISYSWLCHPEACKKKKIFLEKSGISYKFLEIFKQDLNPEETEEMRIERAIKFCDCLLMISGVNETCDIKLEIELEYAQKHKKHIIAIAPWKDKKAHPLLEEKANLVVGWHAKSIADAILLSDQA